MLASELGFLKQLDWLTAKGKKLVIEVTDHPGSAVLASFFAGYDDAFVLPNEKEKLEGFKECLALNHGKPYALLSSRYGPFREIVLVLRDAAGAFIGGASFIAFPLELAETVLSMNLSYAFVDPGHRRKGYLAEMVKAVQFVARAAFEPQVFDSPLLLFIEQNDPLRMSSEDYKRDLQHSGLDQMKRIEIWSKLGARIVDFTYIQPPLSAEQQPDDGLVYGVLGAEDETLDPCLLGEHLRRFFGISVLKGKDPASNSTASALLGTLKGECARGERIRLLRIPRLLSQSWKAFDHGDASGLPGLLRRLEERR